jgi:uroporphyrinogen decarboxylase
LSTNQSKPLTTASAPPGSDCEQAEPLAEFSPFDGQNRSVNSGAEPDGQNRAATTVAQTADPLAVNHPIAAAGANGSRFVRACLRLPVDRTPVWFLRQAGRYMPEYMAVRKHHSLLEICRTPDIAAEVTITAAERLGVDAAIIFADLLLPFTPMGLDFEFVANEGPQVHSPIRTAAQAAALRTDRTEELLYVSRAIEKVANHFGPPRSDGDQLGIIGFCGAPFTLASYMIEGGSSRNYIETKKLMYASTPSPSAQSEEGRHPDLSAIDLEGCHPERSEGPRHLSPLPNPPTLSASTPALNSPSPESSAWPILMEKLLTVLTEYAAQQVAAGADVIQVFDSWVGALSPTDYAGYALAPTTELIRRIQAMGVPVIYFGVDTASLLPLMRTTGADVLGLDWRIPLDQAWRTLHHAVAVQGNLDPITLFAPPEVLASRVAEILALAAGRPGHIFNLGHGIVPGTPVEAVLAVVQQIKQTKTW